MTEPVSRIRCDPDLLEPVEVGVLVRWWRQRRKRKNCFHHSLSTGESWIVGQLVDLGRRKMWWCTECDRRWFS
jgi:hypothetical protein